jgi:hypothetical protein
MGNNPDLARGHIFVEMIRCNDLDLARGRILLKYATSLEVVRKINHSALLQIFDFSRGQSLAFQFAIVFILKMDCKTDQFRFFQVPVTPKI